jgi:hemolysin III
MRGPGGVPHYTLGEEIAHAATHGTGLVLSVVGAWVLVGRAGLHGDAWHVVGCAVFGAALVALYAASTLYHGLPSGPAKRVFRRIDHAAIFLLIAGTYTPFALVSLRGGWGWTLLVLVWCLAILGITLQAIRPRRMARLSVGLYLAMGWMALVAIEPLLGSLQAAGLALLVLGGVAYSVGVAFYAWLRLPYNHAVWHVFVLAGSVFHYSSVMGFVIPPAG